MFDLALAGALVMLEVVAGRDLLPIRIKLLRRVKALSIKDYKRMDESEIEKEIVTVIEHREHTEMWEARS